MQFEIIAIASSVITDGKRDRETFDSLMTVATGVMLDFLPTITVTETIIAVCLPA